MTRYRVVNQDSVHYNEVGEMLDKSKVRVSHAEGFAGRDDGWYAHWDVLLSLGGANSLGVAFMLDEIEVVPTITATWLEER